MMRCWCCFGSAVTNEHASARMRQVFAEQVAPALAAALGPDLPSGGPVWWRPSCSASA